MLFTSGLKGQVVIFETYKHQTLGYAGMYFMGAAIFQSG